MRLIDADDFKKFMQALCKAGAPYESVVELLDKQPTAYDIDKVVEELEKRKQEYLVGFGIHDNNEMYGVACGLGDAIEIVKQGGVSDDVCEWIKQYKTYDWKPSCETNSVYNIAEVVWFKYCPFCGKKIKVVE